MDCEFCGEDIDDKGMLINTVEHGKSWACSDCFVQYYIKENASILHSWGFIKKETEEEPELEEE